MITLTDEKYEKLVRMALYQVPQEPYKVCSGYETVTQSMMLTAQSAETSWMTETRCAMSVDRG